MQTYILLFQCKDRRGIVAEVSNFIFRRSGNIITADQYSTDPRSGYFFMRVEFLIENKNSRKVGLESGLSAIARKFRAKFKIYDKADRLRMGIFVSRPDHCLLELLYLWKARELRVEIPFVASNYEVHREVVTQYQIPFYFVPATKKNKREQELLHIARESDFLVLARYMLVLSPKFLNAYGKDIINIHHGFLPSFRGPHPYRQALQEGVKVIGATSHFVTKKLDAGPIISQAVGAVSHRDNLPGLVQKGRNLEKWALAEAVLSYVDYRIIRHADKTIVF